MYHIALLKTTNCDWLPVYWCIIVVVVVVVIIIIIIIINVDVFVICALTIVFTVTVIIITISQLLSVFIAFIVMHNNGHYHFITTVIVITIIITVIVITDTVELERFNGIFAFHNIYYRQIQFNSIQSLLTSLFPFCFISIRVLVSY